MISIDLSLLLAPYSRKLEWTMSCMASSSSSSQPTIHAHTHTPQLTISFILVDESILNKWQSSSLSVLTSKYRKRLSRVSLSLIMMWCAFRIARIKREKKEKERQQKDMEAANRRHLANMRVVQKNLVYVIGLHPKLATEEVRGFGYI